MIYEINIKISILSPSQLPDLIWLRINSINILNWFKNETFRYRYFFDKGGIYSINP